VSQRSRTNAPPVPTSSISGDSGRAFETSVRQLIANGKSRTALETAKEFHKGQRTAASESLLLDAYAARIQSLLDQNLALEAKSLLDLVRERFPSAKERLDRSVAAVSARAGDLAGLLQPLNDPELNPERRTAIEQIIQTQVTDLTSLAGCAALSPEHNLRQAATALDRAFNLVTSGPVTEEQIVLPEVPYRSPLAAWKVLIRAIARLHRGEDEACRECLAAIKPESVPARLVPAMQAMLGVKAATALKPAEAALVSRVNVNLSDLRSSLANLDRAFEEDANEVRIFKAVRAAVRECQRSAPDRLEELKQIIGVRSEVECLDKRRLLEALEGAPRQDAVFFRMYALAMESSGDEEDLLEACELWDKFRQHAVREGWFRGSGVEAAILYLHMADVLGRIPGELLKEFQRAARSGNRQAAGEDRYFLFPEKLYARACVIDPHPEAFAQWMRWAAGQSVSQAEDVSREWHRIRPGDLEPLLYLMQQAEKRNAFPTALSYLEKAERLDAVHSEVRAARLRLLAAGAMSHLQKKKPHLAAEKLALMASLPQSQQGDRPAFLAALRQLICKASGDESGAAGARLEAERLLGGDITAALLILGMATNAKRADSVFLPPAKALSKQERKTIPASLARVMALVKDLGITKFQLPVSYFAEAEEQFGGAKSSLDVEQIFSLGEMGVATGHPKLAWAASGEGIKRGGPSEARFLLLRARAIPPGHGPRYVVLAAAAAELGRFHRDMDVVDRAVEIVRNPFGGDSVSLKLDQARDVVRKELTSPAFPASAFSPGPDYNDLLPVPATLCQCSDCRRQRGEAADPFDEEQLYDDEDDAPELDEAEMERIFKKRVPKGIPPDLAQQLFEIMKESFLTGESPDEFMSRVIGGGDKQKKGRRKQ
jgi:tetratricopeptide (TPR) repeat protein